VHGKGSKLIWAAEDAAGGGAVLASALLFALPAETVCLFGPQVVRFPEGSQTANQDLIKDGKRRSCPTDDATNFVTSLVLYVLYVFRVVCL
jgi:hypothetical protein